MRQGDGSAVATAARSRWPLLYHLPAPAQGRHVVGDTARSRELLLSHLPAPTQGRHDTMIDARVKLACD